MYERPRVNVKVERGSTFTFTRGFSYITSILIFARILFYFILLASPTGRDTATACANYCGPGTRSQFCRGRKPECPEETLEVKLRLTETQSTYNIVVEVEGVIDVHYASLEIHLNPQKGIGYQNLMSRCSCLSFFFPAKIFF